MLLLERLYILLFFQLFLSLLSFEIPEKMVVTLRNSIFFFCEIKKKCQLAYQVFAYAKKLSNHMCVSVSRYISLLLLFI